MSRVEMRDPYKTYNKFSRDRLFQKDPCGGLVVNAGKNLGPQAG